MPIYNNVPYVFFRVAWMNYYQGSSNDPIYNQNFKWDDKHGIEEYIFLPNSDGFCYGVIENIGAHGFNSIDIERIGNKEGVTVIFFATNPIATKNLGFTVNNIVGWYSNAIVNKDVTEIVREDKISNTSNKKNYKYYCKAKKEDVFLIPPNLRENSYINDNPISRGIIYSINCKEKNIRDVKFGPGQSCIWYGDNYDDNSERYLYENFYENLNNYLDNTRSYLNEIGNIRIINTEDNDNIDRERLYTQVEIRQGQQEFRKKLFGVYKKCAVTGEDTEAVLEAAHIVPYKNEINNNISNGLLLRSDIHILFDKGLLKIIADSNTYKVRVDNSLQNTTYYKYNDKIIELPEEINNNEFIEHIRTHNKYINNN